MQTDKQYTKEEIESILRKYPILKAKSLIEEEKLFGLFPSMTPSYEGMPHGSGISNQTANLAIERASIPHTSRQVRAIEIAYNALTDDCKQLVELYYYQKLRKYEVQSRMSISEDQFKYRREETLETINNIFSPLKPPENTLVLPNCD